MKIHSIILRKCKSEHIEDPTGAALTDRAVHTERAVHTDRADILKGAALTECCPLF